MLTPARPRPASQVSQSESNWAVFSFLFSSRIHLNTPLSRCFISVFLFSQSKYHYLCHNLLRYCDTLFGSQVFPPLTLDNSLIPLPAENVVCSSAFGRSYKTRANFIQLCCFKTVGYFPLLPHVPLFLPLTACLFTVSRRCFRSIQRHPAQFSSNTRLPSSSPAAVPYISTRIPTIIVAHINCSQWTDHHSSLGSST